MKIRLVMLFVFVIKKKKKAINKMLKHVSFVKLVKRKIWDKESRSLWLRCFFFGGGGGNLARNWYGNFVILQPPVSQALLTDYNFFFLFEFFALIFVIKLAYFLLCFCAFYIQIKAVCLCRSLIKDLSNFKGTSLKLRTGSENDVEIRF